MQGKILISSGQISNLSMNSYILMMDIIASLSVHIFKRSESALKEAEALQNRVDHGD